MKWTVVWKPAAERELADIWSLSAHRQKVTDAVEELEGLLKSSPLQLGESRDGITRVAFVVPIGMTFDVSVEDRKVTVLHVWSVKK